MLFALEHAFRASSEYQDSIEYHFKGDTHNILTPKSPQSFVKCQVFNSIVNSIVSVVWKEGS